MYFCRFKLKDKKKNIAVSGHQFGAVAVSTTLLHCTHCGDVMWGVAPQGYQCLACEYTAHRLCVRNVEEPCVGDKKELRRSFISMDSFALFSRKRSNNSPTASKSLTSFDSNTSSCILSSLLTFSRSFFLQTFCNERNCNEAEEGRINVCVLQSPTLENRTMRRKKAIIWDRQNNWTLLVAPMSIRLCISLSRAKYTAMLAWWDRRPIPPPPLQPPLSPPKRLPWLWSVVPNRWNRHTIVRVIWLEELAYAKSPIRLTFIAQQKLTITGKPAAAAIWVCHHFQPNIRPPPPLTLDPFFINHFFLKTKSDISLIKESALGK